MNLKISTSTLVNKMLNLKRNSASRDLDLLFVMPGAHAVKFLTLFKIIRSKKISYLLAIHNLSLFHRFLLLINRAPLIKIGEMSITNGNPKKINNYKISKYLLNTLHPKLLITSTDPEKKTLPFIEQAKLNNIKTITIQHGAYSTIKGADFTSEIALVWGSYYKTWFVNKLNKNPSKLLITGSPFFDKYRIKPYQQVSKKINKTRVLILLTFYPNLKRDLDKELSVLIHDLTGIGIGEVLVRPHPWQKLDKNIFLISQGAKIKEATSKSLINYLRYADAVITLDTTAGFDALIMGKPTIYWNFDKHEALPLEAGGVPVGRTPKQIASALLGIVSGKLNINDRKRRILLREIFYKLDGKSSLRVANVIADFLKK